MYAFIEKVVVSERKAINEKILPSNHPDIERNKQNISKVFMMMNNQLRDEPAPEYSLVVSPLYSESMKNNVFTWKIEHNDETSKSNTELIEMNNYS